jgi:hypothetical protein
VLTALRDRQARRLRWAAIKGAQRSALMKPCSIWTAARAIRDFEIINGVRHDGDGHRIYTDGMGCFRAVHERLAQIRGEPHNIRNEK